jgi:chloramphenicol O-acetyltransferase type A
MKKIDIETWNRRDIYMFYKDVDVPQYNMTFELDVTHFYQSIKAKQLSFYLSFMHVAMTELNRIENFRYRYINHEPYLLDQVHPSYTDRIEDTDRFKIVTVDLDHDLTSFVQKAKRISTEQGTQFLNEQSELRHDLVYITTFPWASFTQVSHAHNLDRYDAVQRLIWGKFKSSGEKLVMPFGIQAHHAFADGMHVGMYIQNLQKALDTFE